jgi:hypothetical protein
VTPAGLDGPVRVVVYSAVAPARRGRERAGGAMPRARAVRAADPRAWT